MRDKILLAIGITEILIGGVTILATTASLLLASNTKAPNVFTFVVITSALSMLLGVGFLLRKKAALKLLIYFSSIIILSKILIFTDIIRLNGALETAIDSGIKNNISIVYHMFLIIYLNRKDIWRLFVN